MKDYYKILGIPENASSIEVKKAYFGLVRKFPPDRYPQEFMKIREAYEVLIDDNTRKQYDATGSMPEIVKKYFEAGKEALEYGDFEKAIDLLERVINIYPDFSVINSLLGDAYYKNDNSGKAIAIFEKLSKDEPRNAGFMGKLAHAYLKRGWHKKAIGKFRKALMLDEDNISLWMGLIDCYAIALDFSKVKDISLEALEVSKKNGWVGLDLYYHLIQNDIIIGDFDALNEHLEDMKEAASTDENQKGNIAWFLANIGEMLLRYDADDMAEALLSTAFELAPGDDGIRKIKEKVDKENHLQLLLEKLRADKSFSDVFADMFEHEMDRCNDPDCFNCNMEQMNMEMHVIVEHESLKRQIMRLRIAFPELYQMKKQFLEEVLNNRNLESLFYKYKKRLDKMVKENPEEFDALDFGYEDEDDYDEDEDEGLYEVQQPYRRDENKVGRNDPCPCGSGKKYKKCCGK